MIKNNFSHTTTSIWSAISFQADKNGSILQTKQHSYSLPVIDEEETKQNISALIKELRRAHTVNEILTLLMECLDEFKFQYMLSHNGYRLAKNISKDKRVAVADIYAFSQAITYCFLFLPPERPAKPLIIVSGVMAPAGQDLGSSFLEQLWQTQGYNVFKLGAKIKPHSWLDAIDKHQPDFLSISCMLNTCIVNLRELLGFISARKETTQVCVGSVAINKLIAIQLSQDYHIPLFYGADFVDIQKKSTPSYENPARGEDTISLPDEITKLSSGETNCYWLQLSEVITDETKRYGWGEFLSYFNYAVIITTASQPVTSHDRKMLIRQLLKIEKFIEKFALLAFSFHYPIPCPFCLPADCREKEGKCMNPAYTRPFPKDFNINLSITMENAKITDLGLSTLILVK
ncbi:MAG: hypothetical protein KJ804_05940 [Proteobacteria bacterium]|nr:hypothetical protein [Pseudomonadota bacterium]MBU1057844.1 hypothetical protein [Pseudomonadota bacterium]